MASVEVFGMPAIERDLEGQPAKVQKAFVRAAKRAIDSGRSVLVKLIAGDTGLQQKVVRDAITMRYPSLSDPVAAMKARTRRLSVIHFKARGPRPSRGQGNGVTWRNPFTGQQRNVHAFIASTKVQQDGSGAEKEAVFVRQAGSKRLPVKKLFGPSIGQVFSRHRPQGVARSLEVFDKNFDHELEFLNSQAGGADAGAA
jgi:hypothetical protein